MNTTLSLSIVFLACLSFFTAAPVSQQTSPPAAPDCQQQVDTVLASPDWQTDLRAPNLQD
ncbi:MAG: hypothetical protein IH586_04610, partial [Anaerolineaceae bacterium]|nr:hypothetical protein [Anaerolineaceae bacterium]